MLEVRGLNQYYGGSHTLWDVELDVPAGACSCVMGRNGMGKSTLLKALMGLVPIRSGTIHFTPTQAATQKESESPRTEGIDLARRRAEQRARVGIGYVPQGREIFPRLSVQENLQVGLGIRPGRDRIPELVFELFPVLRSMLQRRGGDLSGGQQQQLAIGRALVLEPQLLILDEPTEGIQPNIVHEIGDIIRKLIEERGLTVLLVEQKLPFARRVADHFAILDKGRQVASGAMTELSDDLISRHLSV